MIVYLWNAPGAVSRASGISDDDERAREAAAAYLKRGNADSATVVQAFAVDGTSTLTAGYQPTGRGWQAVLGPRRRVRWVPLADRGAP